MLTLPPQCACTPAFANTRALHDIGLIHWTLYSTCDHCHHLQASLAQYRDRYHDLLNQELALSVRIALRNDLKPLTMQSDEQVESTITNAGLPATLDPAAAGEGPAVPFRAPFSGALSRVRCFPCRSRLLSTSVHVVRF